MGEIFRGRSHIITSKFKRLLEWNKTKSKGNTIKNAIGTQKNVSLFLSHAISWVAKILKNYMQNLQLTI